MENSSEQVWQAGWSNGVIVGQQSPFKLKEPTWHWRSVKGPGLV